MIGGVCTLHELQTIYSLGDALDLAEILDIREELDAEAAEHLENKAGTTT